MAHHDPDCRGRGGQCLGSLSSSGDPRLRRCRPKAGRLTRRQARSARKGAQSASAPKGLVPEGRTIVAWHEVPGKASSQESRPVGYGLIHAGERTDSTRNTSGISRARSYRTLRDGSFAGPFTRHFVPGYDRCRPYGTRPLRLRAKSPDVTFFKCPNSRIKAGHLTY